MPLPIHNTLLATENQHTQDSALLAPVSNAKQVLGEPLPKAQNEQGGSHVVEKADLRMREGLDHYGHKKCFVLSQVSCRLVTAT